MVEHASNEDSVHEDDQSSEVFLLAQQAAAAAQEAQRKEEEARARVEAIAREVEENLRAKMALFSESDDEDQLMDNFLRDLPAEDEPFEGIVHSEFDTSEFVRTGAPPSTNSMLSGLNGKKIKIVGVSSKRNADGPSKVTTTTTMTAPASRFTNINKKPQAIDLSDSESEDNIPASAPAPKKAVGRPAGRPSIVPTRGSSSGKRGRGRPRKTI
jgi:hypothetical protein